MAQWDGAWSAWSASSALDPHASWDADPQDDGAAANSGSQLAVPGDGGDQEMAVPDQPTPVTAAPEHITIGTTKAFRKNYPFPYEKKQINSETIYVCTKGSDWARRNEVLVLLCETNQDGSPGTWTAFDSDVSADGETLQCRQPVFRCLGADITQPGWHKWETNSAASPNGSGVSSDWQGALWAETRVP